jgi:hypothetical protein
MNFLVHSKQSSLPSKKTFIHSKRLEYLHCFSNELKSIINESESMPDEMCECWGTSKTHFFGFWTSVKEKRVTRRKCVLFDGYSRSRPPIYHSMSNGFLTLSLPAFLLWPPWFCLYELISRLTSSKKRKN